MLTKRVKWIVIGVFIMVTVACSRVDDGDRVHLIVDLSATPEHLMIDNGNSYVWRQVRITINRKYGYESDIIPRGGTSLNLAEFAKEDGTRFDPKRDRLKSVSIYVPNVSEGRAGVFEW